MTDTSEEVKCDPTQPNRKSPVKHDYKYYEDEYGSLADGGSYAIYVCTDCGRKTYVNLPD